MPPVKLIPDVDPWELQYVKGLTNTEAIAWSDREAYKRYPKQRWIYDKYELSERLGNSVYLFKKQRPNWFPIVIKPRKNLDGMGRSTTIVHCYGDFAKAVLLSHREEMIVQPFYHGADAPHTSTDYIIHEGKIANSSTFQCHKNQEGSFEYFEYIPGPRICAQSRGLIDQLIETGFRSGMVNIETIDQRVIEAHLRPSVQFFDLGNRIIKLALRLFAGKDTNAPYADNAYSLVLRRRHDAYMACDEVPSIFLTDVYSVQLCWEPGSPLSAYPQDEHSYRYAVINGEDLNALKEFAKELDAKIMYRDGPGRRNG